MSGRHINCFLQGSRESAGGERSRPAKEHHPLEADDARERPLPPLPLPHRVRGGLVPRQGRLRRRLQVRWKLNFIK